MNIPNLNSIYVSNQSVSSILSNFVDIETDQEISGKKNFYNRLSANEGLYSTGEINVESNISSSNNIIGNDLCIHQHALVGKEVDFSTGGVENAAFGHNHRFYGKESFVAGNENLVIGAKAFHWKAIDTTNNLIYLTVRPLLFNTVKIKSSNISLVTGESTYKSKTDYIQYDIPYFGPKNKSYLADPDATQTITGKPINAQTSETVQISCLFTAEEEINIPTSVIGQKINLINILNTEYSRKLTVKDVIDGSVLSVAGLDQIDDSYKQTRYRGHGKQFHANHYVVYFPDDPELNCSPNFEPNMTFGSAAFGDNNKVFGYNSYALGYNNTVEGIRSFAIGNAAKAFKNYQFVWSGTTAKYEPNVDSGTFCINPVGGIKGFYIGTHTLQEYLTYATAYYKDGNPITLDFDVKTNVTIRLRNTCNTTQNLVFTNFKEVELMIVNENLNSVTFNCTYRGLDGVKVRFLSINNAAISCGKIVVAGNSTTFINIKMDSMHQYIHDNGEQSSSSGEGRFSTFELYTVTGFNTLTYRGENGDNWGILDI